MALTLLLEREGMQESVMAAGICSLRPFKVPFWDYPRLS
jgi:hypothetical protein